VDQFITADLKGGRLPEVIDRGEPAILVCHWPGIYFNGEKVGFQIFQEVVKRLHSRYDALIWMKLSEIARYWAAKELTPIEMEGNVVRLRAPFATSRFTIDVKTRSTHVAHLATAGRPQIVREVRAPLDLAPGTWRRHDGGVTVCFDLPRGESVLELG
jgi:hypothetical protein